MKNKANSGYQRWLLPVGLSLVVLLLLGMGAYQAFLTDAPPKLLETFGNQEIDTVDEKGNPIQLKIVHKVPDFSFIDQNGKTVTQKDFEGKTYVADFFFTTCETICPIMSKEMMRVAQHYKDDPEIAFLSHTVDPETDSVPQLKAYAQAHQANDSQWRFVTGAKTALYDMARNGYFVTATQGDGGPDDFVHTQNFVLVDKYKQIRGYYDGTEPAEMDKLIKDIALLKAEYKWRDNNPGK